MASKPRKVKPVQCNFCGRTNADNGCFVQSPRLAQFPRLPIVYICNECLSIAVRQTMDYFDSLSRYLISKKETRCVPATRCTCAVPERDSHEEDCPAWKIVKRDKGASDAGKLG